MPSDCNAHQIHVRRGAEQPVLQVAPHAVGDGQRDDERGHSGGHSGDRDGGDHAHHGLPPLGLEVPRRHIELESHCALTCVTRYPTTLELKAALRSIPQGLKPALYTASFGTTEVVP